MSKGPVVAELEAARSRLALAEEVAKAAWSHWHLLLDDDDRGPDYGSQVDHAEARLVAALGEWEAP